MAWRPYKIFDPVKYGDWGGRGKSVISGLLSVYHYSDGMVLALWFGGDVHGNIDGLEE